MTVEEAKQLAENGDIDAMLSLGNYYSEQCTEDGVKEAVKWYEMAANENVFFAVNMTALCKYTIARAGLEIHPMDELGIKSAMEEWESAYDWAMRAFELYYRNAPGTEDIEIEDIDEFVDEVSYYFALCCYWNNRFEDARENTADLEDVRSKILCVAALVKLANTDAESASELNRLSGIITNPEYAASEKVQLEENLYTDVALQFSRMRKNAGSESGMKSAMYVLTFVLNAVKSDQNKQVLTDELKRYRKKLFGGYKYV